MQDLLVSWSGIFSKFRLDLLFVELGAFSILIRKTSLILIHLEMLLKKLVFFFG